ncbi:hypothetical protein [Petropleomorpha daqingensis]|uniref:Mce-associated membrane protein n=1 Tax=Petropleomorpha daqingensis TaxID=2026353 RepID=A0A853CES0_9ACTN|nr:hypothetical protein [Petropleomorpha daqingensis]NYJ04818.1 hypothetical protein [Petropleomorpha daqingensis]
MPETPDERPRPTPRPRPGAAARPSPRPRVAGSRRDRDDADPTTRTVPQPRTGARPARPAAARSTGEVVATPKKTSTTTAAKAGAKAAAAKPSGRAAATSSARRSTRAVAVQEAPARRRGSGLVITLAVLCVLVAGAGGFLLWQRLHPPTVNAAVFSATRSAAQALYAFDYKDPKGSLQRKVDVLTGDLRDQYQKDSKQGGIVDSAVQVSATTHLDVLDIGLQQINDAQDAATLVVFGNYVVKSVNSGSQAAPQGSSCSVTPDGAQSCRQVMRVHVIRVDGDWKIDEVTVLTGA